MGEVVGAGGSGGCWKVVGDVEVVSAGEKVGSCSI